ncbi:carbohydrate porin, partial [Lichenihabitans sp. Uapishka_5]|uniref:carbohydrate porin n=1 Tax=Lichenihabitans sp. Uapishka_5 TaxID=3037302 RepID=UPI0029E8004A
PGASTAQTPGPGTASGASGTASGVGGARRITNVQGNSATPTTPTTLPPGTLDFGNGITAVANYTGEVAGNPYGGIKQGARYADQVLLGVDIDLGKYAGLTGSSLHALGTERNGKSLSKDLIGNSISVQEIYGGGQTYRLTYLSFEQKLFDDRVDFEVGRLPGQVAFLANPLHCNFQNNSICGTPSLAFSDTNFTFFPAPTWAGTMKLKLTDKYFFNIGAYEVAPSSVDRGDHGVDFFAKATGYNVPFELGYATTFDNDPMPRHFGVGAIIDQSPYSDAVLDTQGGSSFLTGLSPEQEFGRTLTYQRFDQMVYRPDPTSPRGLTVFGIALEGTGGRQIETYYLGFGAVYLGPFESRPFDSVDAFVSTQAYSDIGLANIRSARRSMGLSTDVATNQTFFELNYGLQVTPAVRVTPNLQYILDPDQLRYPYRDKPIPDTLVIGCKLSVDLFTLAGLAKGPGSL